MKIEMNLIKEQTIEEFADKHGLIMEVHERTDDFDPRMKFYARFKLADIKNGCCLTGIHGDGSTPSEAIKRYGREISGKLLVIDAFAETRREIHVPRIILKQQE